MAGTNIFNHVSDNAEYVIVQPFTNPGSAFEPGGDTQSLLSQLDVTATSPMEDLPLASDNSYGLTRYATQTEANDLSSVLTSLTPLKLDGVNDSVSPATETQIGNLKEIEGFDVIRSTSLSNHDKLMSYRRVLQLLDARPSLIDTGDDGGVGGNVNDSGFVQFADLNQTTSYDNTTAISPVRTWNLIKTEVPNPWDQATESLSGISRGIGYSDRFRNTSSIMLTTYGLNFTFATTTKKGVFRLTDTDVPRDDNQTIITPGTMHVFKPTSTKPGFAALSSGLEDDSSKFATAADGFELDKYLGKSGGTITGTLRCDNITTILKSTYKHWHGSWWHYVISSSLVKLFYNDQLNGRCGLNGRPVGSIYQTTRSTSPSALFGGSWIRLEGKILVGAGTGSDGKTRKSFVANTTGGEYRTTLTESQLPEHKHSTWGETFTRIKTVCPNSNFRWFGSPWGAWFKYIKNCYADYWPWGYNKTYKSKRNIGMGDTDRDNYAYWSSPAGSNASHNNMMPYKTVYTWRRVK